MCLLICDARLSVFTKYDLHTSSGSHLQQHVPCKDCTGHVWTMEHCLARPDHSQVYCAFISSLIFVIIILIAKRSAETFRRCNRPPERSILRQLQGLGRSRVCHGRSGEYRWWVADHGHVSIPAMAACHLSPWCRFPCLNQLVLTRSIAVTKKADLTSYSEWYNCGTEMPKMLHIE